MAMANLNPRGDQIERRTVNLAGHELRASGEGEVPRITGYAALFNTLSEDLGGFYEEIEPGAFSRTLREADVRGLWNHNADYVLGRMSAGTLKLWEDEVGLAFEVVPPDTQWGRDLLVTIRRGDVREMSFAFATPPKGDDWVMEADQIVRKLLDVDLYDISPVTFPAYPTTSAQVRSRVEELQHARPAHPGDTSGTRGQAAPPGAAGDKEQVQARLGLMLRQLDVAERQ